MRRRRAGCRRRRHQRGDGEGIEDLRRYTGAGRTVALIGASGVGKSTLVNRLVGTDVQATGDVRDG